MSVHLIRSVADLEKFAKELVSGLKGGEIFGLVGDLGAGKTALVKAVAKAFGVKRAVRSPTFILMQLLELPSAAAKRSDIARLCHVDAYRLKSYDELVGIGFHDYAGRADTVTFVEWPEMTPEIRQLPGYREIKISFSTGESRQIELR